MVAKGEGIQWLMTALNTVHTIFETLGGIHKEIPEVWKQRLPGFLGLSWIDEQIFNGVLGQLAEKTQVIINGFLSFCKDYERYRFINIIAGMEVIPGHPEERETKWDKGGNKIFEKVKSESQGVDQRKDFLNKFANIITTEFNGDFNKAHDFCVGGRMIIPDPLHQKMLDAFSESVGWFKKIALVPFGATSVEDLLQKAKQKLSENSADLNSSTTSLRENAKSYREKYDKKYAGRNKP